MKSKTVATWLAFVLGIFGADRFYLRGIKDVWGWLHIPFTLVGIVGLMRFQNLGQNDVWSWVLMPVFGASLGVACLTAIIYALMTPERWNARYNPSADADAAAGHTHWGTFIALALALLIGSMAVLSSFALSFKAYFENQVEAGRRISQDY
jgi:TM2 domain-containing membrane protein YozV